ncbi:hypothetical protein llap_11083 [Limosa lapponica baueri]|uniref:Paxillin n=1 Tax=Limosa lapponica baueri TaxID=1758121 RepID=A0A2I0TXR7_LIMLA|nr:hypothetical protein llap_11083 [Limosa lapponica baueri]
MTSSSLGSNLSELDRLLLELNAVQHNPASGFPADEASRSPSLPSVTGPHYVVPESSSSVGGKAAPPTKEKPKRNGARGIEDVRPSVESLLDELESSVPSPVNASQAVPASSVELLSRSANVEAQGLEYDLAKETEKKEQRTDPQISSVPISNTSNGQGKGQTPKELDQQGAFRDNSALSSQGRSVEIALDELWALGLSARVPEVHAKRDSVLNPVYEPSVVALDRWDVFPDTKNQVGFVVEQGQELKAEVPHETKVDDSPDLVKKRQGRERENSQEGRSVFQSKYCSQLDSSVDKMFRQVSTVRVDFGEEMFMAQGKAGSSSPPSTASKPGSQLDTMLGSLQSDLNKLGVATVAKGVCGACKKPIAGQVVTAMGKTWHPEHFVCTHCQEEIGSRNFFERDGQPYCEKDYHNLFSPRCYYCNGPILDKVVTALDRTWHPEHFFCAQCGAFFGPEGFHEKDGKAYCRKDYFDMFAPKCGGCARAILENYISALNTLWHPECFVCRECFTPFINGSFFEHDGQPYCEVHYHERRGSLCSGCQKPITGRCITAMGKKFHPEHFVCAFCLKQLNKGTFKEQNDKPYCQNCFLKLFC